MAEDFSDLFSKITKQRQLRKEDLRRKTAQAVGGTAATLRGESAPEAFAKRAPDYSKQMMTPEQKRLKRLELLKYQENLDQYYYGKEQDRYLKELREEMQNRRALLQAETAKMREMGASARERARNMRLAISEDIDEDVARGNKITKPSDRLKRTLEQVVPPDKLASLEKYEKNAVSWYKKLDEKQKSVVRQKAASRNMSVDQLLKGRAKSLRDENVLEATRTVFTAAEALMQTGDRDDIVNGIPILANMSKSTPNDLLQVLGGNSPKVFSDLRINQIEEQNRILDDIQKKQIKRARDSARTYGGTGKLGEAQNFLMTAPRSRMSVRTPAAMAPSAPTAAPTAAPIAAPIAAGTPAPAAPEVIEGQEAVVAQQQQQPGFMGVPGVQIPETSQQRVLEMFNIIEQFPEHAPAKQAKMDIMQSEDFKKYASRFGPDAPADKVYKEAVRDARLKAKEGMRKFREKRAEKRLAESKSRLVKERKPMVPVTGSDKGIGEKEDVGI